MARRTCTGDGEGALIRAAAAGPGGGHPSAPSTAGSEAAQALSASGIDSADVLARLSAFDAFDAQRWQVQCDGVMADVSRVAEPGITGAPLEDGTRLKFARVQAADGGQALAFRSNQRNVFIANAPRCEGAFNVPAARLQKGAVYWHAARVWLDDRSATSSRNDPLFLQWHPTPGAGLNPTFALYVRKDHRAHARGAAARQHRGARPAGPLHARPSARRAAPLRSPAPPRPGAGYALSSTRRPGTAGAVRPPQ